MKKYNFYNIQEDQKMFEPKEKYKNKKIISQ